VVTNIARVQTKRERAPVADASLAPFFRVLGDTTRLAILVRLLDRPHTVSELVAALGVPQSRVSNHLACLRWCRFVIAQRDGRRVHYQVADARVEHVLALAREVVAENCEHLASCRRIGPPWV
jgi:DNA-binding transcriptional ArsR family regulator